MSGAFTACGFAPEEPQRRAFLASGEDPGSAPRAPLATPSGKTKLWQRSCSLLRLARVQLRTSGAAEAHASHRTDAAPMPRASLATPKKVGSPERVSAAREPVSGAFTACGLALEEPQRRAFLASGEDPGSAPRAPLATPIRETEALATLVLTTASCPRTASHQRRRRSARFASHGCRAD
ncbi:MAG: hypothetical protein KGP27_01195, partial [Hyphomicrobiales bacterium]|nr:hypothetical protein [Hyphomicrobiales bacterium]